jgi:glycosyltransferase involved in cell wall biosynthesis
MEGISVPSRMYNVMAAGNPMLAVCAEESELAMVVREEQIGFVVEPGDLESMERCVREAMERPEALRQMGERARIAVERKYTRERVVAAYGELLREVR